LTVASLVSSKGDIVHQRSKVHLVIGSLVFGTLAACANSEPTSAIRPLIAIGDDGHHGLVGTYDVDTGDTWIMSQVLTDATQLAQEQGVVDPRLVVAVNNKDVISVDLRHQDDIQLPAALADSAALRACVIEPSTGRRLRITAFRIGQSTDLNNSSEEFIPTSLWDESQDWCWPNCPKPQ
jgi:hypothetical protein